jgi:hypothetical protein
MQERPDEVVMQFYWTSHYEYAGETWAAKPGTSLLVVSYQPADREMPPLRVEGGNDLANASALAETLIDDRPKDLLLSEPDLVFQVQQA